MAHEEVGKERILVPVGEETLEFSVVLVPEVLLRTGCRALLMSASTIIVAINALLLRRVRMCQVVVNKHSERRRNGWPTK